MSRQAAERRQSSASQSTVRFHMRAIGMCLHQHCDPFHMIGPRRCPSVKSGLTQKRVTVRRRAGQGVFGEICSGLRSIRGRIGRRRTVTAVFAHRGCTEGFVENTLDAFAEARRLGADGVELDVRLTADGALAVHHDAEVPGLGPIAELGWPSCPATCRSWPTSWPSARAWSSTSRSRTRPRTRARTRARRWPRSRRRRSTRPAGPSGSSCRRSSSATLRGGAGGRRPAWRWAPCGVRRRPRARAGRGGRGRVPRRPPLRPSVTPSWWTRAHAAGLAVNVWTVNAPDDLRAMVGVGVDAVITDRLGDALGHAHGRGGGLRDGRDAADRARMAGGGPGPQRWSAMNVVVCVKQIPDPAVPGP